MFDKMIKLLVLLGISVLYVPIVLALPSNLTQQQSTYVIELPTNGDSDEERRQDFTKALSLVITKNSSDPKILESSEVKTAFTNPGRYVQRFNYVNRSAINGKQEQFIQINFNPQGIAKLLRPHRLSSKVVLVETKPVTLVWLAVDKSGGKVLDDDSGDGAINILKRKGQEFGLSIILPTLDLQDISNVKVQDVCRLNTDKIKEASQRYGASVIVMGCITPPSFLKKDWSSKWQLLQGGKSNNFTFIGSNTEDIIIQAMKSVAANTAKVVTSVVAGPTAKVTLRITNVDGLRQYNEVTQYLHNLGQISQIELVNVNASNFDVVIDIPGGKQALLIVLGAQHKLIQNDDAIVSSPGIDLNYKWVTVNEAINP